MGNVLKVEKMRQRQGIKRGVALLPNLLTTANLFCGYFAIIKSIEGNFIFAAWIVILAGFFDFLDGRIARMTGTQSDFGMEYDSLADITTFCMAPAVLVYNWELYKFGKIGIAACFLYFACGALRLARFNVQSGSVEKVDFQGLPTPGAAGTVVSYVLFHYELIGSLWIRNYFLLAMIACLGLLMVSRVPYRSLKRVKRTSFFFLVCVVGVVFVVAAEPNISLFALAVVYIGLGLVRWFVHTSKKIKSFKEMLVHMYQERREAFVYDDDDDDQHHQE